MLGDIFISLLKAFEKVAGSEYPHDMLMLSIESVVVDSNSEARVSRNSARYSDGLRFKYFSKRR